MSKLLVDDENVPLLRVREDAIQTPGASRAAVACILFCELCERLTYYSIIANLLIFLQNNLGFDLNTALTGTLVFSGSVYFTPIIGGWLADSLLGRYNTLYLCSLIYAVGCSMLPAVAFDYASIGLKFDQTSARIFYVIGLSLVAVGTGGIKANVSPFGAYQVSDLGQREVQRFFSWFYWFVNIGSGIAYAFVTYVQQEVSFFIGYLIPAITILVAICLLLLPRPCLSHEPRPSSSPIGQLASVIGNALSTKANSIYSLPTWLDYAQITNGGRHTEQQVNGVKQVLILLPLMLPFISFWCIYNQMQSTFLLQAERMNLNISSSFRLPAASLSLFNSLAIIVLTPVLDLLVFPCIRRLFHLTNISLLKRIGFGFLLAILSVLAAAALELHRKSELRTSGGFQQEVAGKYFNSSNVNILLQVPQFVLIGAGEVFASATGMELVFANSPQALKSVTMGIFLAMNGLGSYLGSLLVAIVAGVTVDDPWLPDDINDGHLEYFCILLAAVAAVTLAAYIPVSMWYNKAYRRTLGDGSGRAVYAQFESSQESVPSSGSITLITGDFGRP